MKKILKSIYHYYALITVLMILIPIVIAFTRTGMVNKVSGGDFVDISNAWCLSKDGESIACGVFNQNVAEGATGLSVYYKLPEDFDDAFLFYRTKDVYTRVYMEDTLLYETNAYESSLYNESPGNMWNSVKLDESYAGKWLRLEIDYVYSAKSIAVDHIYLGDKTDIIFSYLKNKTGGILVSVIIIVIAIMIFVTNLFSYLSKSTSRIRNISLALSTFFIGIWSLCETNVIQIFIADGRLVQLVDNMIMFIGMLPMLFYLDENYKVLNKKVVRIYAYLELLLLTVCFFVQVTNISDLHHFIAFAWLAFFVFTIIMVIFVTIELIKMIKCREFHITNFMHVLGFALLVFGGTIEGARYVNSDSADRAVVIRLGMLLFSLCFALGNEIENHRLIVQGAKYEAVSKLAYIDGLTSLGNRRFFAEKINEYKKNNVSKLGIIFADLNNLKQVNDNLGHEVGDDYIVTAAKLLEETFGKYGRCFRVGGDEFCVLIHAKDAREKYELGKRAFSEAIESYNASNAKQFEMMIAHGYAEYTKNGEETIDQVVKEADDLMYRDKQRIKNAT